MTFCSRAIESAKKTRFTMRGHPPRMMRRSACFGLMLASFQAAAAPWTISGEIRLQDWSEYEAVVVTSAGRLLVQGDEWGDAGFAASSLRIESGGRVELHDSAYVEVETTEMTGGTLRVSAASQSGTSEWFASEIHGTSGESVVEVGGRADPELNGPLSILRTGSVKVEEGARLNLRATEGGAIIFDADGSWDQWAGLMVPGGTGLANGGTIVLAEPLDLVPGLSISAGKGGDAGASLFVGAGGTLVLDKEAASEKGPLLSAGEGDRLVFQPGSTIWFAGDDLGRGLTALDGYFDLEGAEVIGIGTAIIRDGTLDTEGRIEVGADGSWNVVMTPIQFSGPFRGTAEALWSAVKADKLETEGFWRRFMTLNNAAGASTGLVEMAGAPSLLMTNARLLDRVERSLREAARLSTRAPFPSAAEPENRVEKQKTGMLERIRAAVPVTMLPIEVTAAKRRVEGEVPLPLEGATSVETDETEVALSAVFGWETWRFGLTAAYGTADVEGRRPRSCKQRFGESDMVEAAFWAAHPAAGGRIWMLASWAAASDDAEHYQNNAQIRAEKIERTLWSLASGWRSSSIGSKAFAWEWGGSLALHRFDDVDYEHEAEGRTIMRAHEDARMLATASFDLAAMGEAVWSWRSGFASEYLPRRGSWRAEMGMDLAAGDLDQRVTGIVPDVPDAKGTMTIDAIPRVVGRVGVGAALDWKESRLALEGSWSHGSDGWESREMRARLIWAL